MPPLPESDKKKKETDHVHVAPELELLAKEEPGQERREWVYASDTAVRPAGIEEVLRARAYLLIYEKM